MPGACGSSAGGQPRVGEWRCKAPCLVAQIHQNRRRKHVDLSQTGDQPGSSHLGQTHKRAALISFVAPRHCPLSCRLLIRNQSFAQLPCPLSFIPRARCPRGKRTQPDLWVSLRVIVRALQAPIAIVSLRQYRSIWTLENRTILGNRLN